MKRSDPEAGGSGPYVGLARKRRPQRFEDLVGQEAVSRTLQNAVREGRIACAYLFFGPRGIGKTTTARILAKALNCRSHPSPTPDPCGSCPSCVEIASGISIDVLEIDAASHTSVENVRQVIVETAGLVPSRDRFKVFIMDEAHMLSNPAFNALLKTMEEPPPHVKFILATTEPSKIPATIFSRCQRFRFKPIGEAETAAYLRRLAAEEDIQAEDPALRRISRAASGSLRDAVSLLEQASAFAGGEVTQAVVQELLGVLPEEVTRAVAAAWLSKDVPGLLGALRRVYTEGFDLSQLLRDLRDGLEAGYLGALGVAGEGEEPDPWAAWKDLCRPYGAETLSFLLQRVNRVLEELRFSDAPRLAVELGLLTTMEAAYDLEGWVGRLEELERRLGSAGGAASEHHSVVPPMRAAPEPAARPPEADKPAVGAPSVSGGRSGELWEKYLGSLEDSRPVLYGYLRSAVLSAEGGSWTLAFPKDFDRRGAEEHREEVERELSGLSGATIRLKLILGAAPGNVSDPAKRGEGVIETAAPGRAEEVVAEEEPEEQAAESASGGWKDIRSAPAPADPGVQKVLKHFPGKVKFPKT